VTEIILGPPGTGKTTTLLDEVDRELTAGTPPDRIGYFSFTRRAVEEAVTRAVQKFRLTAKQLPHFRTLHSMCFRALGLSSRDVFEGKRVAEFADWARVRLTGRTWSDDGTLAGFAPGDRILFMENLARVRCQPLRQLYDADDDALPWGEVERVSRALVRFKEERALLDFTDMLEHVRRSPDTLPALKHDRHARWP
jgi:superfamily I DNA/RNA helicase